MRAQYDFSSFEDAADRSAGARLALAGGSDRPPPDDPSAEVIRFPLERVRPARDERKAPAPCSDESAAVDAPPIEAGALWAAWLSGVLSKPVTGLGRER